MEKSRTIYRLRGYKTPITIMLILSSLSVLVFFIANVYEKVILEFLREEALNNLETVFKGDLNYAMSIVPQAFGYIINASIIAALTSIVGLLILFFYIRTGKVTKLKLFSLNLIGMGGVLMALLYFLVGLYLPEKGEIVAAFKNFRTLQVVGVSFIAVGHMLFVVHIFRSIIFEVE